jgi:twitching motility two-component system response regulator PilH
MPNSLILVVDDSPTDLKLMTAPLQSKGFRVVTAVDGEEALDVAARDHPALIVLDIILPKKNGFQVCRQLKTTPETQDIKIIMLSSKAQDTDRYWGLKQGADEYMTKPFENDQLISLVQRLVSQ